MSQGKEFLRESIEILKIEMIYTLLLKVLLEAEKRNVLKLQVKKKRPERMFSSFEINEAQNLYNLYTNKKKEVDKYLVEMMFDLQEFLCENLLNRGFTISSFSLKEEIKVKDWQEHWKLDSQKKKIILKKTDWLGFLITCQKASQCGNDIKLDISVNINCQTKVVKIFCEDYQEYKKFSEDIYFFNQKITDLDNLPNIGEEVIALVCLHWERLNYWQKSETGNFMDLEF